MRETIMEEQKIENDYNACLMTKSGVANCPLLPFCSYEDLRPGIGYELPRTLGRTLLVPDPLYPSSGHNLESYERNLLPSTKSLVGQYDIIFHAYSSSFNRTACSAASRDASDGSRERAVISTCAHRTRTTTARGIVSIQLSDNKLSNNDNSSDEASPSSSIISSSTDLKCCLEGRVTYDQDIHMDNKALLLTDQLSNFSFVQKSEYQNYITMYTVGLAGSGGIVRCFTERVAVSLLSSAHYHEQVPRKLQSFKNIHEAEELNRRYYFNTGASWLCSHMSLPSDITLMVRRFVCPPPVFFFEKGDLWIFYGLPGRTRLTTVARRRPAAEQ